MFIDGQVITLNYMEAIAILPAYWRPGFGAQLMTQVT
jgi:ribosomal protein S18 acetylase RimI-like enzyme